MRKGDQSDENGEMIDDEDIEKWIEENNDQNFLDEIINFKNYIQNEIKDFSNEIKSNLMKSKEIIDTRHYTDTRHSISNNSKKSKTNKQQMAEIDDLSLQSELAPTRAEQVPKTFALLSGSIK